MASALALQSGLSLRFQVAGYIQLVGVELNSSEVPLVFFLLLPMKVAAGHAPRPSALSDSPADCSALPTEL